MFIKLFIRILAIFIMISLGILAKQRRFLDDKSIRQIANLTISFFYPALIFSSLISHFSISSLKANLILPFGALLIMAIGYSLGIVASKIINFKTNKEKNMFLFQCTINNFSFLPMPIVIMFWGDSGLANLIFSTLGAQVAVWTLGILALTGNQLGRENIKKLLNVPVIAILSAIVIISIRDWIISIGIPLAENSLLTETSSSFLSALDIFGKATIPLAMFIAGSRMATLKSRQIFSMKQVYLAMLRLVIIPAASIALLLWLPITGDFRKVLLVMAIMPSALSSVTLAEAFNSDVEFAASTVLTTHLLAIFTLPLWLTLTLPV